MVDISLAPLVLDVKPYVDLFVNGVITLGIGVGAYFIQKYTGYQITALQQKELAAKLDSLAGALVAKSGDKIATDVIHVNDPRVAAIANEAITALPKVAAALNLTPENVATAAQGAIGKLQASMAGPPALPAVDTPALIITK